MIKYTDLEKQKQKVASEDDKREEEAEKRLVEMHKQAMKKGSEDARQD